MFTVKRALEKCCLQLKATLLKQRALADDKERRKNLTKYIPDVSTAIYLQNVNCTKCSTRLSFCKILESIRRFFLTSPAIVHALHLDIFCLFIGLTGPYGLALVADAGARPAHSH